VDIMISSISRTETGVYFTLACGKSVMSVGVAKTHVTTLVQNAAHKTWRGAGKTFHGADAFDQALKAYKSGEAKAMIEFARSEAGRAA
jgi:hypothetical protein